MTAFSRSNEVQTQNHVYRKDVYSNYGCLLFTSCISGREVCTIIQIIHCIYVHVYSVDHCHKTKFRINRYGLYVSRVLSVPPLFSLSLRSRCLCLIQTWPTVAQCHLCQMTFSDQSAVSAHFDTAHAQSSTKTENPDARHKCEVCGRKFTQKSNLTQHLRTVHSAGNPTYKCKICGKQFNEKRNLVLHLRNDHNPDGPRHQCEVCAGILRRRAA